MKTLSDILVEANAYLDLDTSVPTGLELTTRSNYANRAVWEASAIAQFKELEKVYHVGVSNLASIPLPSGFKEFQGAPQLLTSQGRYEPYMEIKPSEIFDMQLTDKYCYVLGNPREGYTAIFNNLEANCSLTIIYQRFPTGLLTLTDVCELPDPEYVTAKVESFVLQSRRDARFPIKDAEAERRLKNMIGRESKKPGGGNNQIRRVGASNYVLD
jgi:hypothetical protein